MKMRPRRRDLVSCGFPCVMALVLCCGGCTPADGDVLATFLRDLLLNATAAFLF